MCSDTLSFMKIIYALTEVLNNLHTYCEINIHAYHKNIYKIRIYQKSFNVIRL